MPRMKKLDPEKYRDNPVVVAGYLTEAFEENDLPTVLDALQLVMRAQNVRALAEITGLRRENLYRIARGKMGPLFSTILALFAGLDVRFVVQPLPPRDKPPRPKLGRPPVRNKAPKTKRQAARERSLKSIARSNPVD
jgi:probable addiction module antidote protein